MYSVLGTFLWLWIKHQNKETYEKKMFNLGLTVPEGWNQ